MDGIRVNMSSKEGKSETLEPLPSGKYLVAVTDCDLEEIKPGGSGKPENVGKPMFVMEFTVQEGDYENRKAWSNVMLFDGALYSISQMLKAQGVDVKEIGDRAEFQVEGFDPNVIPGPEWWMSKQFVIRVKLMPKRKVKNRNTGEEREFDERAEVKGFMSAKDWKAGSSPKKAADGSATKRPSLLP